MSSHGFHGGIESDGLSDGCDRCLEIAADPFVHLDNHNLRLLWERMVARTEGRSEAERIALMALDRHRIRQERLGALWPVTATEPLPHLLVAVAAWAHLLAEARRERDDAIRVAYHNGHTQRKIGAAAGISGVRAQHIIKAKAEAK